jgi:fibronectin type 3 domain-containing protein/lysophospholipase L1-like esterase
MMLMVTRRYGGRRRALLLCLPIVWALAGVGPAAPAAHAAGPVRLMAVGDSITAGTDGDFTWRYRLAQHFGQAGAPVDFVGDYTAPHEGTYAVGGWDSGHQAVWGMPAWQEKTLIRDAVARNTPDVVVVHLGTNDLAFGVPAATAAADVRAIVDGARDGRAGVKVLLMKIVPRLGTDAALTNDFNGRLAALAAAMTTAESPVAVGDAFAGFSAEEDLYDGTHPNRIGEYKIAAAVARGLWRSFGIGADYGAVPPVASGPDAPTGVTATPEDGAATVAWAAVRQATSYNVYARNLSAGDTAFALVQYGVTATSWRQTMLFNGQQIEYQVSAVRWFDESPASASVRVVPAAPAPATPANVRTSASGTAVTVSWDAVAGVDSYSVYARDVTAGQSWQLVQFGVTGTSWTQVWLSVGHVYEYTVVSVFHGVESARAPASTVEIEPPGIPQNVRAASGNATAAISWSAVGGAGEYRVYARDATAGQAWQLVQFGVTGTSWTQVLLTNGHRYEYAVTAVVAGVESGFSAVVIATPNAPKPAAPAGVNATTTGTSIRISWSAVPGAASYTVYGRDRTAGESAHPVQWNVTGTAWTHQLLTPGHVYEYYVTAVAGAESDPSATVRLMAGGPRPGAPGSLSATAGNHAVALSWSAVSGAESYTVYGRDVTAGESWRAVQWGLGGTSWTHSLLTNGHQYAYYVVAIRGYLEGGASPTRTAVPFQPAPATPTGVRASGGDHAITIAWNAVAGAESYTVYRSEQGSGFAAVQWGITGTSWTQTMVSPYRENTYYVTAVTAGAASAPSARVTAMATSVKGYPCNYLTPARPNVIGSDSNGTLSFQWNKPIGADSGAWGFQLSPHLRALGNGGTSPAIGSVWYMVNGNLDSNTYHKAGPGVTVLYFFHSTYHGLRNAGLLPGQELQLTVSVSFDFVAPGGGRGHADVRAHDCYQLTL